MLAVVELYKQIKSSIESFLEKLKEYKRKGK